MVDPYRDICECHDMATNSALNGHVIGILILFTDLAL
jgi:hypothetical protein